MTHPTYTLILRNGTVLDGTGAPGVRADIAISNDRIAAVGEFPPGSGKQELDIAGLVVSPGFIDVHTHDDRAVLIMPAAAPKVTQGVTTVITGNCGISLSPVVIPGDVPAPLNLLSKDGRDFFASFAGYAAEVTRAAPAVNVAPLIGHMSLRVAAGVDPARAATAGETAAMQDMLAEALRTGAFGFSTGLAYPLNQNAPTEEVIALAQVAGRHGGVYTTHMRDEGEGVMESLEETFRTAAAARVRVMISHHKCLGTSMWGRSTQTLAAIDAAGKSLNVGFDAYPYTASSTVLMPYMLARSVSTLVTWSTPFPEASGRRVEDIAREWGCTQEDAAAKLSPAGAIYESMDEADVRRILGHPRCMIGSDGLPHDQHPHPRLWGAFPRVLGHYCRDVGLFSLPQAVHKMTGLPARQYGIADRGVVAPGAYADLCVFDPATIRDVADFAKPTEPAAGIVHVLVNGEPVLMSGTRTGASPGRLIANPGLQS